MNDADGKEDFLRLERGSYQERLRHKKTYLNIQKATFFLQNRVLKLQCRKPSLKAQKVVCYEVQIEV